MKLVKYFGLLFGLLCLLLTQSCANDGSPFAPPPDGEVRIGSGTGTSFVDGAIELENASIPANGSTTVSVNFVDSDGALANINGDVVFTSTCADLSQASFTNATVQIASGSASTTYTDQGCTTIDTLTATATLDDETELTASSTLTIAASTQGNTIILFTSVDQSTIALAGTGISTGIPEVSNILFTVQDSLGNTISNEAITFSISSQATSAGIRLQTASSTSNSSGEVTATVQSGTVATSFRVTATVTNNTALSTQSTPIVVATGLPDVDSFSLSATELNPRAWNVDGKQVTVTARVGDRFNNPIQDGTQILFTTELGQVEPSCTTSGGSCSVQWTSSDPRGTSGAGSNAGRTTILATVDGEESFQDNNSNGFFDDGDFLFRDNDNTGNETAGDDIFDMTEAFLDINENGTHDAGEFFYETDSPADGFSIADGLYNGPGCQHTSLCNTTKTTIKVSDSLVLVMAENTPDILKAGSGASLDNICDPCGTVTLGAVGATAINYNFTIVGNTNNQVLPGGTTVDFTATGTTIQGTTSFTVPNTNTNSLTTSATVFSVTLVSDGTPSSYLLEIKVTTPDSGPVTTLVATGSDS